MAAAHARTIRKFSVVKNTYLLSAVNSNLWQVRGVCVLGTEYMCAARAEHLNNYDLALIEPNWIAQTHSELRMHHVRESRKLIEFQVPLLNN